MAAQPRLGKDDTQVVDEFGFEFSEPPEKGGPRRSKYDERWDKARDLLMKFPGRTLKVISYDKQSQPYNIARAINNGEHRAFADDAKDWTAVAGKDFYEDEDGQETERWSVWLTYNGEKSE